MGLSKDRIGDINAQVEDALGGIRVVQAFGNEGAERAKFDRENERFLQRRKAEYWSETLFFEGMVLFTQLMPIAVIVFGGVAIARGTLDLPDLLTFLLYITILIEPIKRFSNFTRLYQEGMTGFERFVEMLEVQPEICDRADALDLQQVNGRIDFNQVSFKYRDDERHVLRDL